MLIDTHCHLDLIHQPIEEILMRAAKQGVTTVITQGTNVESSMRAAEIATKFPNVYATVGIHPEEILSSQFSVFNETKKLEILLTEQKVIGIGEVGLDYFILGQRSPVDGQPVVKMQQIDLFKAQIELAIKYQKSLVIHDREAIEDVIRVLEEKWSPVLEYHTVFHCCPADERLLAFAREHHIFIGIDGDITWSKKKQRFIAEVPLEMLVLETDAPFLIPLELKQTVEENEPAHVSIVRDVVSRVKEVTPEVVSQITTNNSHRLFNIHIH